MQTYSQFQPTGFDTKGLGCSDRQDWIVAPVAHNRDSNTWEESNFATAQKMLATAFENEQAEVHRFGHWANGWFEIILVHPSRAALVQEIEDSLENYPLLDESDFSDREYEAACKWWNIMGMAERVRLSRKYRFHLMACRRDELPSCDTGELVSYLADGC